MNLGQWALVVGLVILNTAACTAVILRVQRTPPGVFEKTEYTRDLWLGIAAIGLLLPGVGLIVASKFYSAVVPELDA